MYEITWLKRCNYFALIISSFVIHAYSDVPRLRGVSLSKASLYLPSKDFTCFDGTATIPFNYVNDDYCDCFDGSDEPGTPACLNGVFHCTNAGHRSQNIPSSRVNDAVCDCCDGTDEYASSASCPNICEDLGREAKAEAQRLSDLHKAGSHLRLELIEKGNKKRGEMADQLSQLEKDKAEADKIKAEKEMFKNELEAKENELLKVYKDAEEQEKLRKSEQERESLIKEATEQFTKIDSNNDDILTKEEIIVVDIFDRNKDGQVDEEEIKYFMGENENIDIDTFISTAWPLLKPLIMMNQGMFQQHSDNQETVSVHEPETDENDELPEDMNPDEDIDDDNVDVDSSHDESDDQEDLEHTQTSVYDEETQRIVNEATEARRQHSDAERIIREIEANIRNIQQNLEKDYGLQQEYTTLDGQCFEYEDKEYIYKLCLFQKVTQKSKNGGGEIGLGNWGEWVGEPNKYSVMKYTNGVACWNGPNRITIVNIHCGLENKLLSVTEPYRCEYKIEFNTPAACDNINLAHQTSHDEL